MANLKEYSAAAALLVNTSGIFTVNHEEVRKRMENSQSLQDITEMSDEEIRELIKSKTEVLSEQFAKLSEVKEEKDISLNEFDVDMEPFERLILCFVLSTNSIVKAVIFAKQTKSDFDTVHVIEELFNDKDISDASLLNITGAIRNEDNRAIGKFLQQQMMGDSE